MAKTVSLEAVRSTVKAMAAGGIDGDGKLEVVFGAYYNDEHLYAINAEDGSVLWTYKNLDGPIETTKCQIEKTKSIVHTRYPAGIAGSRQLSGR